MRYEKERAFYIKQRYLTDMIVPFIIERGDVEALFLVKDELDEWQKGKAYINGSTVLWKGCPVTCVNPYSSERHPDWDPETRPEFWHHWKRGKGNG